MQRTSSTQLVRLFSVALVAGSATLAEARQVDYVDVGPADGIHINNGRIEVSVVNGEYAQASSNSVPFNLRMKAGCKGNDVMKGAFISRGDENVSNDVLEYSGNFRVDMNFPGASKTMPYTNATLQVPLDKLGADPVQICRDMMQEKMSQGVAKHQILNSEHTRGALVKFTAVASCGNLGNQNGITYAKDTFTDQLKVVCKAGISSPGGGTVQAPKLPITAVPLGGNGQVQVGVNPLNIIEGELLAGGMKNFVGSCPAQLSMAVRLRGSGKGLVRVHVVDGSDKIWESPPQNYDGTQGWKQMNFFYNLPALPEYLNQKKQRSFRLYVELKDENADSFSWSPKGDLDTLAWSHTCKSAPAVPMGGPGTIQMQPAAPGNPGFAPAPGAANPPAPSRAVTPTAPTPKPPARATTVKPDEEEPEPAGLLLPAVQKAR